MGLKRRNKRENKERNEKKEKYIYEEKNLDNNLHKRGRTNGILRILKNSSFVFWRKRATAIDLRMIAV